MRCASHDRLDRNETAHLARAGLVTLTLLGLFTLYQVLFDLWMLAYPFADPDVWRNRL